MRIHATIRIMKVNLPLRTSGLTLYGGLAMISHLGLIRIPNNGD